MVEGGDLKGGVCFFGYLRGYWAGSNVITMVEICQLYFAVESFSTSLQYRQMFSLSS